jgi:hypothetical protein
LKVRPFAGSVPGNEDLLATSSAAQEGQESRVSLEDISTDLVSPELPPSRGVRSARIRQPATGETRVRIPAGAAPGSKIMVPGPRGSRLISITVPEDFKPGDMHVFEEK